MRALPYFDRRRAERLMREQGVDALVITMPENFRYVTGMGPGFAASWRRAGIAMAIVPAQADDELAVVITDVSEGAFRAHSAIQDVRCHPIWTELVDLEAHRSEQGSITERVRYASVKQGLGAGRKRPQAYELDTALGHLRDVLREKGFADGRVGIELDFIPANDLQEFRSILPQVEWVDSSRLLATLRLYKQSSEIALLRTAVELAECGIRYACDRVRIGQTAADISYNYQHGILHAASERGITNLDGIWSGNSCGPDPWGAGTKTAQVAEGDVLKFDAGCTLGGYTSDMGRTFVVGRGDKDKRYIYHALLDSFRAGQEKLRPGVSLREVHGACQSCMHRLGFDTYTRGHFGHGIGSNVWVEEWPFISSSSDLVLEPSMAFAYETPFYLQGVGGFIIEDQVVITGSGYESMNSMSVEYTEVQAH